MDDFKLLGIAETKDPRLVKEAFRARAKELHPDIAREDLGDDPLKRHLLFVALTQAYRRVLSGIGAAPRSVREAPQRERKAASSASRPAGEGLGKGEAGAGTSLAPHRDPAYALYKTAMRFYMAIHPSAWAAQPNAPSAPSTDRGGEDDETREKVRRLIRLFPKAYYYFSLVVTDYPDSPWAADAREKMETIERRTVSYKRIIESFGAWKRAGRERGQEVSGIVERTKKLLDEEGELRWPSPPKG
jgi:hypothetical protein